MPGCLPDIILEGPISVSNSVSKSQLRVPQRVQVSSFCRNKRTILDVLKWTSHPLHHTLKEGVHSTWFHWGGDISVRPHLAPT